jgi:DNA-binding XRE family transcriptional regulator
MLAAPRSVRNWMTAPSNKIAELRKKRKMSQQQLADAVGSHWVTISNIERGKAPLTLEWANRIGKALQVDADAIMQNEEPPVVHIEGMLGSHGIELWPEGSTVSLPISPGISIPYPFWLVISDNDAYPIFQIGDLARVIAIDHLRSDHLKVCIGCLCVVEWEGSDRAAIGYLNQGRTPHTFSVTRITAPPINEIKITKIGLIDRGIYQPELPPVIVETLLKG